MGTAIVSLLAMGVMLMGTLMLSESSLSSFEDLSASLKQMESRMGEISRTRMSAVTSTTSTAGSLVDLVFRNDGQEALKDFSDWDLVVQYYDGGGTYVIIWLPFSTSTPPGDNQWIVDGIFLDAVASTTEVFDPGILNPGEEIKIQAKLSPAVGAGTSNLGTVSTPNGVTASINFSG